MNDLTAHEKAQLARLCLEILGEKNLVIEQTTDFARIPGLIDGLGKTYLTRELSPAYNDFKTRDSFWLLMKHQDPKSGEETVVGMIGCRCDDLSGERVKDFLAGQLGRLYGVDGREAVEPDHYPPVMDRMSGKIVSVGDFYMNANFRGSEKFPKRALVFLLYTYASIEWKFDWLYAMIRKQHADIGFITAYCGAVSYPACWFWKDAPAHRDDTDYFVAIDRHDYAYLTRLFLLRPEIF